MAKRKNLFVERRKTDRQANDWFDRTDDNIHFQAFSGKEEQQQTGDEMLAEIRKKIRYHKFRRIWLSAAAAVLLLIGGTAIFIYNSPLGTSNSQLAQQQNDILPGSDKALLILSNGSTVSLSAARNGQIAVQEGLEIEKTQEGEIVYRVKDNSSTQSSAFNSVVTPNGGQYRVTLPDGSKALLNAASSLTYPVRFTDTERLVKMTGEVYFEIAKATGSNNNHIPFFVETDKQEIQVLGTHFNVNAYTNESMVKTTLVEGSVKVKSRQGQTVLLKPGQQALLTTYQLRVETVDIQQQLAWKNGDFIFKSENLQGVLRQIARWYDIEVVCPEHLQTLRMNGMISRSKPLSTIIDMIETTHKNKITLTLKGRRLIVTD